jgi:hypothetical protein
MDERDVAYIRDNFITLDEACAGAFRDRAETIRRIALGALPRPSYVVDDVPYVPRDYFDIEISEPQFVERYLAACALLRFEQSRADAIEAWGGYLSGLFGVCLHSATPENIARKGALLERITALLRSVDELDGLERPFSPVYDRERFGRPPTRDTFIAGLRARFEPRNLGLAGKGS